MNSRSAEFARAFRVHVLPKLRVMIHDRGQLVANGDEGFVQAEAAIFRTAYRLGAGHLSDTHREALEDWIAASLMEAVSQAEHVTEEAERLVSWLMWEPSRAVMRQRIAAFLHGE